MGKFYKNYADALAQGTECSFEFPFSFKLPSFSFPPPIPFPDLSFEIPSIPFYCPLD